MDQETFVIGQFAREVMYAREYVSFMTRDELNAIFKLFMYRMMVVVVVSQFNGTSTPKGSYSAKTGDNDCNVNLSRYSLSTAMCESNSLSGQVWSKCPTRPDTQGRHVEAALMQPYVQNELWYQNELLYQ